MSVRLTTRERARRHLAIGVALAAVLSAGAACGGSSVPPRTAAMANAAANGHAAGPGGAASDGGAMDGAAPVGSASGTGDAGDTGGSTAGDTASATGTAATGGGTGGTESTGSTSTSAPGTAPPGSTAKAAAAPASAGSCAGFHNQTGITDTTLSVGNAADVSGPVPGLFQGAQQATKAYVAYFNATHPHGICGRKLVLDTYDSRTDAGADQQAYTAMCSADFAGVGSLSVFDDGGAGAAQGCGLPDVDAIALTTARNACSTCFAAQSAGEKEGINAVPDFLLRNEHAATQKAALLWLNTGAAAQKAQEYLELNKRRGWTYAYSSPIDVSEFNYGPYVQQMKSKGVQLVQLVGAYQQTVRLAQAMQNAGFKPAVFLSDPSVYDPAFAQSGGASVNGVIISINFVPFEEHQRELDTYKQWLQQSNPGAVPSYFGMYAWSAAKLFTEAALTLGGKLTRPALIAQLRGVHAWTGGGMHAAMDVGGKHPSPCVRFIQLNGSDWRPFKGTKYVCDGLSKL